MSGWNAKGLLRPLWERLPGKRDELAALTGIRGNDLSRYNSGKQSLGIANARKIAAALNVSLVEIGGPAQQPDERPLPDRLEELAAKLADLDAKVETARVRQRRGSDQLRRLADRVEELEDWRDRSSGDGSTAQEPS